MSDLVLYSLQDDAWKIADFGLTKSGTSQGLRTTKNSQGTEGYRAPELLRDDARYNNKVDIFAIGCILYELICQQKAFGTDYDVREWSLSSVEEKTLPPGIDIDEYSKTTISQLITQTLSKTPGARPSAQTICQILGDFFGHSMETQDPVYVPPIPKGCTFESNV